METIDVEVQGRRVRSYHAPGKGPTVVLIHGAGGNGASWAPVVDRWYADVWCPSLPGRDGSDGIGHRTVAEVSRWLQGWLREQGGPRPWLVGHSFGGAVALETALRAPELLAGIAMVCSGAKLRVAPAILEAVAAGTVSPSLPTDAAFGAGTERSVVEAYRAATKSTPVEAALGDWHACDAFDVRAELASLRVPLRVVYSTGDLLTPPRHQRKLIEATPGAAGVELDGHGHMLPWEAPEAVAGAVLEGV